MLSHLRPDGTGAVALVPLTRDRFEDWSAGQPEEVRRWLAAVDFSARPGTTALLPSQAGGIGKALVGVEAADDPWAFAALPTSLPPGLYRIEPDLEPRAATRAALGWALGCYRFERYRASDRRLADLVWPATCDRGAVERAVMSTGLVRDLVNTPANDLGPAELAEAARALAEEFGARFRVIVGDELLAENYPTIHAVGRGSARAPRLIDFTWGDEAAPKVTLVGKGVCFDSGGLDLKPSSAMLLMKKDMGGAAHVLGVARMVMAARLPVRLRVLIPAVENFVSADSFRPLDVIRTRKGITVEIGNTDAEGRLVLCDALDEASRESPALLVDVATLTGAARVALGPELPAMFCNDEAVAADLLAASADEADPLWRMPLWKPYLKLLDSKVADINNSSNGPFAGAITAALYLERFVAKDVPWVHVDTFAWNPSARPGRPEGGEALGMRALYALIERRFGGSGTANNRAK